MEIKSGGRMVSLLNNTRSKLMNHCERNPLPLGMGSLEQTSRESEMSSINRNPPALVVGRFNWNEGLSKEYFEHFNVLDPYNNNQIEGYICRKEDYRYGALEINKVNGIETEPQIIYCVPKFHYPCDKQGNFHWPDFKFIFVYEKIDGTSVVAYSYHDNSGQRFVTFKTRLTAIIRGNKFGDYKTLWDEILIKYPQLRTPKEVLSGQWTFAFELYGYRNPILIKYDVSLATRLLFGVHQKDASIMIPSKFIYTADTICLPVTQVLSKGEDVTKFYNDLRAKNLTTNIRNEDGSITGSEGFVFYAFTEEERWLMYKAKSEDIEKIHWANGGIDKNAVYTTVMNALENIELEGLTVEYINTLLAEDFTIQQIARSLDRVDKAIKDIKERFRFKTDVLNYYTEYIESSYSCKDKHFILSKMSKGFKKNEMHMVYNMLRELNILGG